MTTERTGFDHCTTDVLHTLRSNLLAGLELVAQAMDDGTLDTTTDAKGCPPRAGGSLTLTLLNLVTLELVSRGELELV